MPHLHKPNVFLARAQGLHEAVDAVAWQAEYDVHVPGSQALDQNICGGLAHVTLHRSAPGRGTSVNPTCVRTPGSSMTEPLSCNGERSAATLQAPVPSPKSRLEHPSVQFKQRRARRSGAARSPCA